MGLAKMFMDIVGYRSASVTPRLSKFKIIAFGSQNFADTQVGVNHFPFDADGNSSDIAPTWCIFARATPDWCRRWLRKL